MGWNPRGVRDCRTRVCSVAQLGDALRSAIRGGGPAVLSVAIDQHEYDLYC